MENISKTLSYILRHKPEKFNIILDKNGYAPVDDILKGLDIDMVTLENIVSSDNKGRYSFNSDKSMIRANQGHSVISIPYKKGIPPTILYHGTKKEYLNNIKKKGLLPMNRSHVHLSSDIDTATNVASRRKGDSIILKIDTKKMINDNIIFYISDNGIWLVDEVSPKYIIWKE